MGESMAPPPDTEFSREAEARPVFSEQDVLRPHTPADTDAEGKSEAAFSDPDLVVNWMQQPAQDIPKQRATEENGPSDTAPQAPERANDTLV